jgi:hypothetical protein
MILRKSPQTAGVSPPRKYRSVTLKVAVNDIGSAGGCLAAPWRPRASRARNLLE